jgi:hypothetical protein
LGNGQLEGEFSCKNIKRVQILNLMFGVRERSNGNEARQDHPNAFLAFKKKLADMFKSIRLNAKA